MMQDEETNELRSACLLYVRDFMDASQDLPQRSWMLILQSDIEVSEFSHHLLSSYAWIRWVWARWCPRGALIEVDNVVPGVLDVEVALGHMHQVEVENGVDSRWINPDTSLPFFEPRVLGDIAALAVLRRYLQLEENDGGWDLVAVADRMAGPELQQSDSWQLSLQHGLAVQIGGANDFFAPKAD